jgi:hypothetical protein
VKRRYLLRTPFIQQIKVIAIQTGYRLSVRVRYRHVEVNEALSLIEHWNGRLCERLGLRAR